MLSKVSLVVVLLCLFSSWSIADDHGEMKMRRENKQRNHDLDKRNFLRAQLARSQKSLPESGEGPIQTAKNSVKGFKNWMQSSWKKFKRNTFSVNKSNLLPTGEFKSYTESSGPHSIYIFFMRDEPEDPDGEVVSLEWNFGDGSIMHIPYNEVREDIQIRHVFPSAGSYEVTLRIYDNDGEFSEVSRTINVYNNQAPAPNFDTTPQTGNIVDFAAEANDPENSIVNYRWDFGDGSPVEEYENTNLASHEFPSSGTYDVSLEVTDDGGIIKTIQKKVYVDTSASTSDAPYPIVKMDKVYSNGATTVHFDASLSVDAANASVASYEWDFGDYESVINYSTLATPIHKYKSSGTFRGRLRIKDTNNNSAEYYFTVYIAAENEEPQIVAQQRSNSRRINFIGSPRAIGGTLDENKTFWNFGDGKSGDSFWADHTYAVDGTYNVRLVAYDVRGIRHSVLHKITVSDQRDRPNISRRWDRSHLDVEQSQTYDASESEDPQGQPLKFYWNFGDGTKSSGAVVDHDFSEKGHYSIYLIVTNSRGLSHDQVADVMAQDGSETRSLAVYGPRIGTAPLTVSFDGTQSFSSDSTIVDKIWQFDGDVYETANSFSKNFNDPGSYFFRLYVVDALGNESVMGREIIVLDGGEVPTENAAPNAVLQVEYDGENPGDLVFKAWDSWDEDGWIPFYEWTVDGVPRVDDGELFASLAEGQHTIVLTVRDEWNASSSITRTFRVNASRDTDLDIAMTPSNPDKLTEVDFDGTASLVNGVELSQLWWDFGDGNAAQGAIVHHVYANAGTYTVKLSITDLEGHRHSITEELIVSEP